MNVIQRIRERPNCKQPNNTINLSAILVTNFVIHFVFTKLSSRPLLIRDSTDQTQLTLLNQIK